jgi:DNA polymerase-1
MMIYANIDDIKDLSIFKQLDHPVALTAPLIVDDQVLIGMYCHLTGSACMHLDINKLVDLKHFLYDPKLFRLLVHGIKRIWENHEIGTLDTYTDAIYDSELMAYLLDSGRDEHEYSLSRLAYRYLDVTYPHRADDLFEKDYPEVLYELLAYDAELIADLAAVLLDKMDADLQFLYFYAELRIALILNEMSRYGIPVDGQAAAQVYRDTVAQREELEQEITGGKDYNLWDGSHVYQILKERKARFPSSVIIRREEVSEADLKRMSSYNPIASKILTWRDLLRTDLKFLEKAAGKSRIHPRWNMITKTSRITASNPAVQNVNKVTCRPLMRPEPGWVMIKADYKQIQMRILVSLSNDPELVAAFREGRDVHWLTVEMCSIQGATDKERRDKAKAVNYGILFQQSAHSLSRDLGTDVRTAQGYINAFWAKYSVAKKYLDDFVAGLKEKKLEERIIRSYLGRMRHLDGKFGRHERNAAKASLLQQMEADILRIAVMRLYTKFRSLGMKSRIVMVIHDAVYVEAPEEESEQARYWTKAIMEDTVEMPIVSLVVDICQSPQLNHQFPAAKDALSEART